MQRCVANTTRNDFEVKSKIRESRKNKGILACFHGRHAAHTCAWRHALTAVWYDRRSHSRHFSATRLGICECLLAYGCNIVLCRPILLSSPMNTHRSKFVCLWRFIFFVPIELKLTKDMYNSYTYSRCLRLICWLCSLITFAFIYFLPLPDMGYSTSNTCINVKVHRKAPKNKNYF